MIFKTLSGVHIAITKVAMFVFSKRKFMKSADHLCNPLQQKRWTKRLQLVIRSLFVF